MSLIGDPTAGCANLVDVQAAVMGRFALVD